MKVLYLLLFSLALPGASASESDIVLQPVDTPEEDTDRDLYLQVKETAAWSSAPGQSDCELSSGPWGERGEIGVNVEEGANLTISLALPPDTKLFTQSKGTREPPASARVQVEFKGKGADECVTLDKFYLYDVDDERFFVGSTRTVGDSTVEVLGDTETIIQVSRCQLSISLHLDFTGCQNWHGGEGAVFEVAVPITDDFSDDENFLADVKYEFEPCTSFISFEYNDNADRERDIRFLEEPESAIKTENNCPFNQTMFDQGRCQICPTPTQAQPTSQPTTMPTVAPVIDAGSYVILSIMGVGFILTIGIIIQSYRK